MLRQALVLAATLTYGGSLHSHCRRRSLLTLSQDSVAERTGKVTYPPAGAVLPSAVRSALENLGS